MIIGVTLDFTHLARRTRSRPPESLDSSAPHHNVLKYQLPPPHQATLKGVSSFSRTMVLLPVQTAKAAPQSGSVLRAALCFSPRSSRDDLSQATGSQARLKIAGKKRCHHLTFVHTCVGPAGSGGHQMQE